MISVIDDIINKVFKQGKVQEGQQEEALEILQKQFVHMRETLNGKTEDIIGRYDNVLDSFEGCVDGDIHNNTEFGNRYDEVQHMKYIGVDEFQAKSDVLAELCKQAIHIIDSKDERNLEMLGQITMKFIDNLYDMSNTTEESMLKLEDRAFDFLKAVIEQQDKKTAGLKRPEINGKEIDVTPRKRTIDGQLFSVKPLQVNGQWVVQKTPINLQGHATGSPTFDSVEQHPEIFKE